MTYGDTAPTITPSYSGFVNGDDASSLTTAPTCSTAATSSSPVGTYLSSCSGAADAELRHHVRGGIGPGHAGHAVGDRVVGTRQLRRPGAGDHARVHGFRGRRHRRLAHHGPDCSTTATSASPVGSYPTSCSGAVDPTTPSATSTARCRWARLRSWSRPRRPRSPTAGPHRSSSRRTRASSTVTTPRRSPRRRRARPR